MIFVTVGSIHPFDRLIQAVDQWLETHPASTRSVAQTGETPFRPQHMDAFASLSPVDYQSRFQAAQLVVAHAGMGTIISALQHDKPTIVFPRRHEFGEHVNDHQVDTVSRFGDLGPIRVAQDEQQLHALLDRFAADPSQWKRGRSVRTDSHRRLESFVESFLFAQK
jgi:UDP-N-acetylglucosamine transferase subunit ALG13